MSTRKRRKPGPAVSRDGQATTANAPAAVGSWSQHAPWLVFLAILAATLIAYRPAWQGALLWDDDGHVTPAVLQSLHGLWRIWFDVHATHQYYPIVHTVFWLEHQLWGDGTLGYHLVNIILHACSACLVAVILRRLAVPGALLAAVLFALHPIQVESVAWISELKNCLSGACYLGAALAYLHFDEKRAVRMYALALALFFVALFSKTVTATLPVSLLVVFWWQRGRLSWRRDVWPLVPLIVMGVAAGLTTAWVERTVIGASGEEFRLSLVARSVVAGHAIWFYLAQLAWPAALIFNYPRWQVSQTVSWQVVYPATVMALLVTFWRLRWRAPLAAMLLFGAALSPALGLVSVYPFRYSFVADHFAYLATIPIFALAAAGAAPLLERLPRTSTTAIVAMLAVGVPLGALTWRQAQNYADPETLYRATLASNPDSWLAHNNLAAVLLRGRPDQVREGVAHAEEALRLNPTVHDPEARYNLGVGLESLGQFDAARAQYEQALSDLRAVSQTDSRIVIAYRSLGRTLRALGRPAEAVPDYRAALRLSPQSADLHTDLGMTFAQLGQPADAIAEFSEALRLDPRSANRQNNLGVAFLQQGHLAEAAAHLGEALRMNPNLTDVHFNLGVALEGLGRTTEAVAQFTAAVDQNPNDTQARAHLARLAVIKR